GDGASVAGGSVNRSGFPDVDTYKTRCRQTRAGRREGEARGRKIKNKLHVTRHTKQERYTATVAFNFHRGCKSSNTRAGLTAQKTDAFPLIVNLDCAKSFICKPSVGRERQH
ncbi:unnamed protein product, partial [Ectocarpus fasciculatus]